MSDNPKFDREFLRAALALAAKPDVDHFLYICDMPIAPDGSARAAVPARSSSTR